MSDRRRRSPERRRAVRRDVLGSLALVAAIFVSILALPVGRVHESACRIATDIAGREVPCGLTALDITIDPDRHPYISIAVKPLKLPISL
jgi:hypothetical protein